MANIIGINTGSINGKQNRKSLQTFKKILKVGNFEVYEINKIFGLSHSILNYEILNFNIFDDPNINIIDNTSNYFENVNFVNELYGEKIIELEILLVENKLKSLEKLIYETKQLFAEIKGVMEIYYKGEMMQIEIVKQSLNFNLKQDFPTFNISWKAQPFFKSQKEIIKSGNINGNSGTISENILGDRVDLNLEITANGNTTGGLKIGDLLVDQEINGGDIITADFQTGKVLLNGNSAKRAGSLPLQKNKINIPIEFLDKIIYPPYNEFLDSTNGVDGNSVYNVTYGNISGRYVDHYFPNSYIHFLKSIKIGIKNYYNVGVVLYLYIYDGDINNNGNLLYSDTKYIYAGQNVSEIESLIEGDGLNISNNSHLLIKYRLSILGYPGSGASVFQWKRTHTGIHGIGTSYLDGEEQDFSWNIKLEGTTNPYQTTTSNISNFDYKINYFNKYL